MINIINICKWINNNKVGYAGKDSQQEETGIAISFDDEIQTSLVYIHYIGNLRGELFLNATFCKIINLPKNKKIHSFQIFKKKTEMKICYHSLWYRIY
jgi:hypothetical protein